MSSGYINLPQNGVPSWASSVATATALPALNNTPGDVRVVLDTSSLYEWNGTSWVLVASASTVGGITNLIGDGTASGPGVATLTLSTVNPNTGTFGSATQIPSVTVNGKGLITGVTTYSISPSINPRVITSISTPTTGLAAANTDYVYFVSGTTTFTMPTAVGNTNLYTIKNTGSNTVTIAFTGGQTGDGSTTLSLPVANTSLDLISDNSNWRIV